MGELRILLEKSIETIKTDGPGVWMQKAKKYAALREDRKTRENADRTFADVLFINGCLLPHPPRYRVTHQREQLLAADLSSNEVNFADLTLDLVRLYRVFIFFRCPYTDTIGQFIQAAREEHKTVLYDIDDLVIDAAYTKSIAYLDTLPKEEQEAYYEGLLRNRRTLELCDGAITTTERLAEELKKYVPYVYINRNTASEEMLYLSEKAQETEKRAEGKVRLGYFSGSITHNDDFDLILPVVSKLMACYPNLELLLAGELDLPENLRAWKDRIEYIPFGDWRKLPGMIARADINLAPLTDNLFNEAKSENKWVEAALVKVPTVASRVGAFAHSITHGSNGMLCASPQEWEEALRLLIENEALRTQIGNNAYTYCRKHRTTIYTAVPFADEIRRLMHPNLVFIVPVLQISGGLAVILKHCTVLKKAGYDVAIINQGFEKKTYIEKDGVNIGVINFNHTSIAVSIDRAVATLWTTYRFFEIYAKIARRYYLVQGYETDFSPVGNGSRIAANRTYCSTIPVQYLTVSKWCCQWLKQQYGQSAGYVQNGLDTRQFYPVKRDWSGRKIRILVEGSSADFYKNVDESFRIVNLLDLEVYEIWFLSYQGEPKKEYHVDRFFHKVPYEEVADVYRSCDILLKSSLLESFSYPPLEMMATGGYVVAAPNEGNVEYLADGVNCLFYTHADLKTASDAIARISNDAPLRERLYENGLRTAAEREWGRIVGEIVRLYEM